MRYENKKHYFIKRKVTVAASVAFLTFFFSFPLQAQQLNFRTYGPEDGVHQSQIVSICQDGKGYMWFGSYSGVSRYNGYSFKTFDTSKGLKNNSISAIARGQRGIIYFATQGGGVNVYDGTNFSYIDTNSKLKNDHVNDLLFEEDGRLWVATNGALTEIYQDDVRHYTSYEELKDAYYCSYVYRASNGELWLGTERGLYLLKDTSFVHVPFGVELRDPQVNVILEDGENALLVGTSSGLLRKKADTFELRQSPGRNPQWLHSISTPPPLGGGGRPKVPG